jgi:sterol desaturase/sphingolipid hydroxylase (fatty acid hydroxylase superfamily)
LESLSAALRFHPLEALYTAVFNVAVIALVGAPVAAVVVYEIVSVLFASFAHGNLGVSPRADRLLRRAIVTPDLHRVHHSIEDHEQATNFAAVSPIWDRLFGTYKDQPDCGHAEMEIGLRSQCDGFSQSLLGMLTSPFQNQRG